MHHHSLLIGFVTKRRPAIVPTAGLAFVRNYWRREFVQLKICGMERAAEMDIIVPVCGFIFVMAGLNALDQMRQGKEWARHGIVAGLAFAGMAWIWMVSTAR